MIASDYKKVRDLIANSSIKYLKHVDVGDFTVYKSDEFLPSLVSVLDNNNSVEYTMWSEGKLEIDIDFESDHSTDDINSRILSPDELLEGLQGLNS